MCGIIERITIYPEKGAAGNEVSRAMLVKDTGLEGDYYARGGERQLSLRLTDSGDGGNGRRSGDPEEKGLCTSRFKENIAISGLEKVKPGMHYTAGEAIIEISGENKHCYDECSLFRAGKTCSLAGKSLFAKVQESGLVRVGDKFELNCV